MANTTSIAGPLGPTTVATPWSPIGTSSNGQTFGVSSNPGGMASIYSPTQPGGAASTSPVINSSNAQADYQAKLNSFQNTSSTVSAANTANAQQAAIDAQIKAENDSRNAQAAQQQKNTETTQNQAQQVIDQKNAALGLATNTSPTNTQSSTSTTPVTSNTAPQGTTPITPVTNGTSTNNGTDNSAQQQALTTEQQQMAQLQQQRDQNTQSQLSLLSQLQTGSIPLTPAQNTVITSLQTQLSQNTQYQQIANSAFTGAVTESLARSGGEYTPQQSAAVINNAITSGVSKIQALDNSAAQTMANLEMQFQKENYTEINSAYDILDKQLTDKANTITTMYTQTTAALKDQRDYSLNVAKFNQTKDQNAFDNAFKIEQENFNEKNKTEQNKIDAFKAGMGAGGNGLGNNITAAQMGADGKPDPVSQKQAISQISQTYGPMTAVAIQGLVDYSRLPSDWKAGSTKGMTRDQAVTLAQMVDPTYTEAGAPARQAYMKSLASTNSGTVGGAINSANKSINHLTAFVNSMEKIGNKDPWETSNALAQTLKTPFSPGLQQNVNAAKTEGLGVADELAKFFKGTGSTNESEINAWKAQLSTNASPASVRGLTQGAVTLLAGQLETLSEQYKSTMGKAPDANLLGPSALSNLSNLKNQGYDVPIPGVYYTSKEAFQKYGGGTQDQWNASIDSLTKAGIPLTDENIAQWAQMN